ncbi:DUF2892 domain-containing protein [Natrarchaeobius oligotrophus]|uniref:DUF2892 domain-containing protein n=1 Tax=Natrarchaeobius chitinivorans TaxID=1679083 RepID=A0A3N6PJZ0_NATCH|nr:DUF2892 domain-containing protein [Natrarchaeobius chitinivorans]RQH01480.1 DUF2892 domain-containing protein [Natrarchaeobius chitinivorans]
MDLPSTAERVPKSTSEPVNERIRRETADRLRYYGAHPEEIDARLTELDEEWDVERTLEANAASLILLSLAAGATVDRRVLAVPAVVAAFLLQHALQGWCPPIPVLRRLGVRTQREIDAERRALTALRDDA